MAAAVGNTDVQILNRAISFSLYLSPVVELLVHSLFPSEFSVLFCFVSSSVKNAISVIVELSLKLR